MAALPGSYKKICYKVWLPRNWYPQRGEKRPSSRTISQYRPTDASATDPLERIKKFTIVRLQKMQKNILVAAGRRPASSKSVQKI
jgi:hypothetical protein